MDVGPQGSSWVDCHGVIAKSVVFDFIFSSSGVGELHHLVLKPLTQCLHLFGSVGRKQVLDGDIGRRNQDRFRVCEGIKSVPAVVLSDAG